MKSSDGLRTMRRHSVAPVKRTTTIIRSQQRGTSTSRPNSSSSSLALWLVCLSCFLLGTARAQSHSFTTDNATSIAGTWSSGSGAVTTGPGYCNPVNYTFNVPQNTGISFSFTDDGYFEEAHYQFNANGSEPHCIQAYLIFQRGSYTFQPNGSITTAPIAADGRIEVQDPCAYTTTVMTYYNQPGLYSGWSIINDANHNQYRLQMYAFDGSPLSPMWLKYNPASMWPVGVQLTTNATIKENQSANGAFSAANLSMALPSAVLLLASALAFLVGTFGWNR